MHVKFEPNKELEIPTQLMDDYEMDFREELFGNNLDASESNSDDDFLSRLSNDDGPFAIPNNGLGRNSTSSSSTCSDSSSMGCAINDLDYQTSLYLGLEDGHMNAVKLEDTDFKVEPLSPEMSFLSDCSNNRSDTWDFLLCNNNARAVNPMAISVPETPPVTPPEGFICKEESPPHSPSSGASPPLVHTSHSSSSLASALSYSSSSGSSFSSPGTRIIKIPKRMPDTRPTAITTVKKKIAPAPKVHPIKFVTIKANGAELPQISTITKTMTSSPTKPMAYIPSNCSNFAATKVITTSVVPQSSPSLPPIAPAISFTPKHNNIDVRALKRQQRKIKNRESASASRKRKKMYVQSLEEENTRLREENDRLYHRISSLEKECLSVKSTKRPSITRSSTVLLGVAFLFLFNFSMIFSRNAFYQNSSKEFTSNPFTRDIRLAQSPRAIAAGEAVPRRSLLWLSSFDTSDESTLRNATRICPLYINASESLRIENELRDWFDLKPESKADLSTKRKSRKGFHPKTKFAREKALAAKTEEEEISLQDLVRMDKALAAPSVSQVPSMAAAHTYKYLYRPEEVAHIPSLDSPESPLSRNLHSILEAIERRDDTYYVVSLSQDHLLVPALSRNSSATRPRMSLLISPPKFMLNHSLSDDPSQVGFMQIDCEITHTQVVQVARGSVPSYLPPVNEEKDNRAMRDDQNLTLDSVPKKESTSLYTRKRKHRGIF